MKCLNSITIEVIVKKLQAISQNKIDWKSEKKLKKKCNFVAKKTQTHQI